jgi:hypothetical protein
MKPLPLILTTALCTSVCTSALSVLCFKSLRPCATESQTALELSSVPAATPARGDAALSPAAAPGSADLARVADLEALLARTQADMQDLASAREAAPQASAQQPAANLLAASNEVLLDAARSALSEEREKQAAERARLQQEWEQQRVQQRAAAIAKELGLGAADQDQLLAVLSEESRKRDELRTSLGIDGSRPRDFLGAGNEAWDQYRKASEELRTWKGSELEQRLGSEVGKQIMTLEQDRRGRSFGQWAAPGPDQGSFAGAGKQQKNSGKPK